MIRRNPLVLYKVTGNLPCDPGKYPPKKFLSLIFPFQRMKPSAVKPMLLAVLKKEAK